jgi:hypothetical protein
MPLRSTCSSWGPDSAAIGGGLASEAFEYLLGRPEIDDPLRQLLWKHRRGEGFEGTLGEVQELANF